MLAILLVLMCYDYEWKTELRPPFSTSEPNSVNLSFYDKK